MLTFRRVIYILNDWRTKWALCNIQGYTMNRFGFKNIIPNEFQQNMSAVTVLFFDTKYDYYCKPRTQNNFFYLVQNWLLRRSHALWRQQWSTDRNMFWVERYRLRRAPRTRKHVCSLSIVAGFGYDIRLRLINAFRCMHSA